MQKLNLNVWDIVSGAAAGAVAFGLYGKDSWKDHATKGAAIGAIAVVFSPTVRGLIGKVVKAAAPAPVVAIAK